LDNNNVRKRINIYKHLTPSDKYFEVFDSDLGISTANSKTQPQIKNTRRRR